MVGAPSSTAVRILAFSVALGLAVTACGAAAEPVRPAVKAAIVSLAEGSADLEWAEAKATAECMAGAGFRYPPYEVFQPSPGATGRFGGFQSQLTVEEAQAHGYEGRITMKGEARLDPSAALNAYVSTLTEADRARYWQLLNGQDSPTVSLRLPDGAEVAASSRGCVAQARKEVYGSVLNYLRLFYFPQQVNQFGEQAESDPAVRRALERYASCMRGAGYDVGSPADATRLAQERFGSTRAPGSPPTDAERAMGVADARCQAASSVHRALDAALISAASAWLNQHEGEILALADIRRRAMVRAKRILES